MDGRPGFARRSRLERLAARLVTGPLGHLSAFLVDLAVAWLRWGGRRVARAARRGRSVLEAVDEPRRLR